jgi:hypothetical protein
VTCRSSYQSGWARLIARVAVLPQSQKSKCASGEARGRGGLGALRFGPPCVRSDRCISSFPNRDHGDGFTRSFSALASSNDRPSLGRLGRSRNTPVPNTHAFPSREATRTPGDYGWGSFMAIRRVIAARLRQSLGQRANILSRYAPIFAATLSASSRSMASQHRSSKSLKV